jgi:hypothetical protein
MKLPVFFSVLVLPSSIQKKKKKKAIFCFQGASHSHFELALIKKHEPEADLALRADSAPVAIQNQPGLGQGPIKASNRNTQKTTRPQRPLGLLGTHSFCG